MSKAVQTELLGVPPLAVLADLPGLVVGHGGKCAPHISPPLLDLTQQLHTQLALRWPWKG
jgi:hypothetical protein